MAELCTRPLGTIQILKHRRCQEWGGGSRYVQRPKTGGCGGSKIDQSTNGVHPLSAVETRAES